MSNRIYKMIVAVQIGMIALLFLFVLNAEQLLEKIRVSSEVKSSYSQDGSWELASLKREGNP